MDTDAVYIMLSSLCYQTCGEYRLVLCRTCFSMTLSDHGDDDGMEWRGEARRVG